MGSSSMLTILRWWSKTRELGFFARGQSFEGDHFSKLDAIDSSPEWRHLKVLKLSVRTASQVRCPSKFPVLGLDSRCELSQLLRSRPSPKRTHSHSKRAPNFTGF